MLKNTRLHSILITLICLLFSPLLGKQKSTNKTINILNGNDLKGWKIPKGNEVSNWYQVTNNILEVRSGPKKKGSVLWTEKEYQDFEVSLGFRFIDGIIDSGIHLRNSDQIQIGISGSLKRDMTCSPYIPGKGYPVEAKNIKELLKPKGWNQMRIRAIGQNYTVWLQEEEVMKYKSSSAEEKGPIGIQLHGNRNMKIDFKEILVMEL